MKSAEVTFLSIRHRLLGQQQREVAVTDTGLICALMGRRRVLNALVRRTDSSHDEKLFAPPVVTLTFRLDIKLGFQGPSESESESESERICVQHPPLMDIHQLTCIRSDTVLYCE